MRNVPERLHADPPAREAPSVHVDGSDSEGVVLELLLARFDRQEEKLERVGAQLERVREEHVETRAELTATRRALAELTGVVKSTNPTFDVNEQLASVVFSHVTDVRTRVALSLVNTVWRGASKVASSLPAKLTSLQLCPEMLHWYMKGARHGNTECERTLGCLYFSGKSVVQRNVDTALRYFEKAAAKGDAAAQCCVGQCHTEKGRYEEAFKWYTKSAAQGYALSECILGLLYEHGEGVKKDIPKAIEWYEKSAAKGHAAAQNGVGDCHFKEGRHEEAFKWYTKAAAQGYVDAEYNLGCHYEHGDGVKKDIPKAIEWYEKAAAKGDADAQNNAGLCHFKKGRYDEAFKWWTKAAAQGHVVAEYGLGWLYQRGNGVKKDIPKAIEWYEKAAAKGDADAQNGVGVCHSEKGRYDEAFKWYTKAAAQGHTVSEYNLGSLYEDGCGVKKDISKATEKGHASAAEALRTLTPAA